MLVMLVGLVLIGSLNVMMIIHGIDVWTDPDTSSPTFWRHFEVSGYDPFTYIIVTSWRPLYVLVRHPLLAIMISPLTLINSILTDAIGINCSLFIVALVMTLAGLASWMLLYRINRRLIELSMLKSLMMTLFYFSMAYILLITFTEDHMAFTMPLLLLTVYWAGKAIKEGKTMSLKKSLPLMFIATGVTTTNFVKVIIADISTRIGKQSFGKILLHCLFYILPLGLLFGLYQVQMETTQKEETERIMSRVRQRMATDSLYAQQQMIKAKENAAKKKEQTIDLPFVTDTDYKIDRLPSVVENIFGEGIILHEDHALGDPGRDTRPVYVEYNHWYYYLVEAIIVALFIAGIWFSRRQRLCWIVVGMFAFDMILHVGLNFASADVYIMTPHWAFVIPITIAMMLKQFENNRGVSICLSCTIVLLTVFLLAHNIPIIVGHF